MSFLIKAQLFLCFVAALAAGMPFTVHAADKVHFTSTTFAPSPFKIRVAKEKGEDLKQQPGVTLAGHFRKPAGKGPFPALVLLHGCSGLLDSYDLWAEKLTDIGYATLLVDSFSARRLTTVCDTPMQVASPQTRALDAHGALSYLSKRPDIDPQRIGLLGWSHGAMSALSAVNNIGLTAKLPQKFKAIIAFYPQCLSGGDYSLPILILSGEADNWTPAHLCARLKKRSTNGGKSIELITYPDAYHGFDLPEYSQGVSINGALGIQYWIQYHEKSHKDSVKRVQTFLARHLKP